MNSRVVDRKNFWRISDLSVTAETKFHLKSTNISNGLVPKILISKTFSFFIVLLLTKGTTYQGEMGCTLSTIVHDRVEFLLWFAVDNALCNFELLKDAPLDRQLSALLHHKSN